MANKGGEWASRAPPYSTSRKRPRKKYSQDDDDDRSPPEWAHEASARSISPWTLSTLATTDLRRLSRSEEREDSHGLQPLTPVTTPTTSADSIGGEMKIRGMYEKTLHLEHDDDNHDYDRDDDCDIDSVRPEPPKDPGRVTRMLKCLSALEGGTRNSLKPWVDELRGHITDLTKDYERINSELDECDERIRHLQTRRNLQHRENEDLRQDLNNAIDNAIDMEKKQADKIQTLNGKLVGLTQAKARLAGEIEAVKSAGRKEVEEMRSKYEKGAGEIRSACQKEMDGLKAKHQGVIDGLKVKHQQDIDGLNAKHQQDIDDIRAKHERYLEEWQEIATKHAKEMTSLDEEKERLVKDNRELYGEIKRQTIVIEEKDALICAAGKLREKTQELEKTVVDLTDVNQALRVTNKVLDEHNSVLEKTNDVLEKNKADLQRQLEEQTAIAANKEKEAAEALRSTASIRQQFTGCLGQITQHRMDNEALQKANATLQEQMQAERSALQVKTRELDGLLEEVKNKAVENATLKEELGKQVKEAEALRADKAGLANSVKSLQTQVKHQVEEAIKLKKQRDKEKAEAAQRFKGQLASRLEEASKKSESEKLSLNATIKSLQEELTSRLDEAKKQWAKEKAELTATANSRQTGQLNELDKVKREKADLIRTVGSLRGEIKNRLDEIAQVKQQKQALHEANLKLQAELKDDFNNVITQAKEKETLQKANKTLETKLKKQADALANENREKVALREANISLEAELAKNVNEIARLAQRKKELQEACHATEVEYKATVSRSSKLMEERDHLREDNKALTLELTTQRGDSGKQVEAFQQTIEALHAQLGQYQNKMTQKDAVNADLVRDLEALHELNKSLEAAAEKHLAEMNHTSRELQGMIDSHVADAAAKGEENSVLRGQIQTLLQANQGLKDELNRCFGEVSKQERELQELQGKHDVLVSRNRELEASLKDKDDEIETLRQQTPPALEAEHMLGSGLPSPFIKPEASEPDQYTTVAATEPIPDLGLAGCSTQQAANKSALQPGWGECLQIYNQLGCGVTRLFFDQFGLNLISEPLHETNGLGNEVVVKYLTTLGSLARPNRVNTTPPSGFWRMETPWVLAPIVGVSPRPDLTERFVQLCFLVTTLRDRDDSRLLSSVASIVASLIAADHSEAPLAGAAFLQTMATLTSPIGGGVFRTMNAVLAILICELCRRLEQVLPDAPKFPWTIGTILGQSVQQAADAHPIGKLAALIAAHDRTSYPSTTLAAIEEEFPYKLCIMSTTPSGDTKFGLVCCVEGQSFLIIDFADRSLRLVDCRLAISKTNEQEPRKHDLIVMQHGRELFHFPKAPRRIAGFWFQLSYAGDDDDDVE